MADINNMIAAGVQVPQLDFGRTLLIASQLRNADTQNQLARMNLMERGVRTNALRSYNDAMTAGDPNAIDKLSGAPDVMVQVATARNALDTNKRQRFDFNLKQIGTAARGVLPYVNTPQFKSKWQEAMDSLKSEGVFDDNPQQYDQWRDNPSPLVLQQALATSSSLDAYLKMQGLEEGKKFSSAISGALDGGRPAPGANASPGYYDRLGRAESGNNPAARAATSSAGGLYQFLESTWADLARRHPNLGLTPQDRVGTTPEAIAKQNAAARVFTAENDAKLSDSGVAPNDGNLRVAHFLGADGAVQFIKGTQANPETPALELATPNAVAANKSVFFNRDGTPRSAGQVYSLLTNQVGGGGTGATTAPMTQGGVTPEQFTGVSGPLDNLRNALPVLIGAASNPGLPKATQSTALELSKLILSNGQLTNTQKNYTGYVAQELANNRVPKSQYDWELSLKKAGATSVNMAGGKELSKGLSERALKAQDAATEAAGQIRLYETVDNLLDDPNVYTGTAGQSIASLKKLGTTLLGLNFKGVANAEVVNKITDELALSYKKQSQDSATSNYERQIYERMAVGLNDSAQGRKLLVQQRVADLRHKQQQAKVWRDHIREDGAIDPKVFSVLAEMEASRRETLGQFLETANKIASDTPQRSPTAGADNVKEQLKQKYGLE
jgi:hypothetical protein